MKKKGLCDHEAFERIANCENDTFVTSFTKYKNNEDDNEIYIMRDDLIPFSFGGNKVRIAQAFYDDMLSKGKNCMVGYGSTRSNLCRVLANMSCRMGIDCHIITSVDKNDTSDETNNSLIIKAAGATIHKCEKDNVSEVVKTVLEECKIRGLDPYYIYGDCFGNGNEEVPVRAYAEAYEQIRGMNFDYIFLATGTGMTQAGLIAGRELHGGNEKIVGVSVARKRKIAENKIRVYLEKYYTSIGKECSENNEIIVNDEYIGDGYSYYTKEISQVIKNVLVHNGIPLDPTYTGKAFHAMLDIIKNNGVRNKKILFIHTGGTPIFFDESEKILNVEAEFEALSSFIYAIDPLLPTPLSQRVVMSDYIDKLYNKARIFKKAENGEIVSLVAGYMDNMENNMSYITLVGTLPKARKRGYAKMLMEDYISECKKKGIAGVHLHVDKSNEKAISLYKNTGFIEYHIENEPRPDDCHLVYWIKREELQ